MTTYSRRLVVERTGDWSVWARVSGTPVCVGWSFTLDEHVAGDDPAEYKRALDRIEPLVRDEVRKQYKAWERAGRPDEWPSPPAPWVEWHTALAGPPKKTRRRP